MNFRTLHSAASHPVSSTDSVDFVSIADVARENSIQILMRLAANDESLRPGAYKLLASLKAMRPEDSNNKEHSIILASLEKLSVTGRDDFDPYFAAEVATLQKIFKSYQRFGSEELADCTFRSLDALQAAHKASLEHRHLASRALNGMDWSTLCPPSSSGSTKLAPTSQGELFAEQYYKEAASGEQYGPHTLGVKGGLDMSYYGGLA